MAELADALDSGSSESNFMQVQVLFPAPERRFGYPKRFFLFYSSMKFGDHIDLSLFAETLRRPAA